MWRYTAAGFVITFYLFFIIPTVLEFVPTVSFLWHFDGDGALHYPPPGSMGTPPFNGIPILDEDGVHEWISSSGQKMSVETEKGKSLLFVPFYGVGFFSYQKVGKEILFHDSHGETLWSREHRTYPVSGPTGELILLLSGDGNRVDIIDKNGVTAGPGSASGNILNDYDFSTRDDSACLVFGDHMEIIRASNRAAYRYDPPPRNKVGFVYMKSCAISGDGRYASLHYSEKGKDFVALFDRKKIEKEDQKPEYRLIRKIPLDRVYPHLLHMAVNSYGLLINAPEKVALYSQSGEILYHFEDGGNTIYQPLLALNHYFVFGRSGNVRVLNRKGREIVKKRFVIRSPYSYRILAGKKGGFAIHNDRSVTFYKVK